ncbi:site-2 protease family protein [Stieleria sp. JC731]|uniref:site-2 protease family protein n=1 Tax=Pirellulaceae TaxID=2691357 RepID=UPI001E5B0F45|nr:site-2 protease family protein [Stieleria sp. JC731]MCC9601406.1 site-2 protease family protein [Stieleria sp. JC731]
MLTDLLLLFAEAEPSGLELFWAQVLLWTRVALGIGVVIFVHELGHFVAAKTFGVKCEKFYIGFDPPLKIGPVKLPSALAKFRYGETEYGIGVIPLGGYVKMLGQDDDPRKLKEESERAKQLEEVDEEAISDDAEEQQPQRTEEFDPRSLPAKPVWQRMIIMSAGVFMNVITGGMFAAWAFMSGVTYTPTLVGSVVPGGPAWQANLEPGGQVISIAGMTDTQMRFRDMKKEVLHSGIEDSEQMLPVSVQYGDDVRDLELPMMSVPGQKYNRLIGIGTAFQAKVNPTQAAVAKSAAAEVLTEEDRGAEIVSFNSTPIDSDAKIPSLPLLDYIFTHPKESIPLVLKREDGSEHEVSLPVQKSSWVGLRVRPGNITALVKGGPAEKAGMQVGDEIVSVEGLDDLNVGNLLLHLADKNEVMLSVKRGGEEKTLTITPDDSLQTSEPFDHLRRFAAMNAYGFAFEVSSVVASFDKSMLVSGDAPQAGDTLKEVVLVSENDFPQEYKEKPLSSAVEGLSKPWKFGTKETSWGFFESLQVLPVGTKFRLLCSRGSNQEIIESTVQIGSDSELVQFDRGLVLAPFSLVRVANSFGEAVSLGIRESKNGLSDVTRFLKMGVSGRVDADMVGGPIRIFQVAGYEAERGFSAQLLFLTMLSMNLAILNFLPVPVLDGGHIMFLIYEAVRGRRVNEEIEYRLTLAGFLMLLAVMVMVFYNDIRNMLG